MPIPFRDNGRSFSGADCFGLYLLILAGETRAHIADPGVSSGSDQAAVVRAIEVEIASGRWIAIATGNGADVKDLARCFDAVIMTAHLRQGLRVVKSELHIGCALGDGMVVHTEEGAGCQVTPLDDPAIINRVTSVYRPRALAGSLA